jgi:hypothetical protein
MDSPQAEGGPTVRRPAVYLLALLAFAIFIPGPALASTSHVRQSVRFTTADPCTNERLRIQAEILITVHFNETQVFYHEVDRFRGTGLTTGTQYVGHREAVSTFTASNGALEFTDEVSTLLVSKGSTDNFVLHAVEHFTSNNNGATTVDFHHASLDCKG